MNVIDNKRWMCRCFWYTSNGIFKHPKGKHNEIQANASELFGEDAGDFWSYVNGSGNIDEMVKRANGKGYPNIARVAASK